MSDNKISPLPTIGSLKSSGSGLPKIQKLTIPGKASSLPKPGLGLITPKSASSQQEKVKSQTNPAATPSESVSEKTETPSSVSNDFEQKASDDITSVQSADEFLGLLQTSGDYDDEWSSEGLKTSDSPIITSELMSAASGERKSVKAKDDVPEPPAAPAEVVPPAAPAAPAVSVPPAAPAAPAVSVPPAAPAEPAVSVPPAAPAAPAVSVPPAAPAAEVPHVSAVPEIRHIDAPETSFSSNPAPAPAAPVSDEEAMLASMTPEERAAYEQEQMLASMTPEERAAYEQEQMLASMTPEERAAYEQEQMLANMTPEERAAYEQEAEIEFANMSPEDAAAYEAEQRRREEAEELKRQQRKQEAYETYLSDLQERSNQKTSNPIPIIIAIVAVLAIAIGGIVWYTSSQAEEEAKKEAEAAAALAAAEAEKTPEQVVFDEKINWYSPNITCPNGATLYVNGVETTPADAKFASDYTNTVTAYSDGMVPFFASYKKNEEPSTIEVTFEPDELYLKTTLEFKFDDASVVGTGLKATFDGRTLNKFPIDIEDVVMGVPHTLILEKPGYAPHYHLIWPTRSKGQLKSKVNIPAMQTVNNAQGGSTLNTKPFPASAEPYGIRIRMGSTIYSSPSIVNAPHGAFVEYSIRRNKRKDLAFSVFPDKYGTVMFDTVLLPDPIGTCLVSFKNSDPDIQICFRREAEVICPDMKAETTIPSGMDWKVIGYTGSDASKHFLRGEFGQELKSRRGYVFSAVTDSSHTLKFNQEEWRITEKKDDGQDDEKDE